MQFSQVDLELVLAYNAVGLSVSWSSSDQINWIYELAILMCLLAFLHSFAPRDMSSTERGGDFCTLRKIMRI